MIQGAPGPGKTVVAIYLMKLLSDIKHADLRSRATATRMLSEFFVPGYRELLEDFKVGFVVPQQSLRKSTKRVFKRRRDCTSRFSPLRGRRPSRRFDLLVVDETHRLNQRAARPSGAAQPDFPTSTASLRPDEP